MSKFIENHPSAIKVWLFYKRKEEKSGLYEKLCNVIGENKISEEKFKKLFEKMNNLRKREIRQLVAKNQSNLRLCILSDVIEKKSFDKSILNIAKIFGTLDIDYQDFEFWFNRFSSGNWNLDQKTFSDFPIFVVSNIAEKLNFPSQMRLRKVSRGLQKSVDQVRPSIDRINYEIKLQGSQTILKLEIYKNETPNSLGSWDSCYRRGDSLFDGMKTLLSSPRLKLTSFTWKNEMSSESDVKFIDVINSLNHKLEIRDLVFSLNGKLMINLVKAVKPKTLELIEFNGKFEPKDINRLAQLDQWKKMKSVYFWKPIPLFSRCLHHFQHFEWVSVKVLSLSIDDILFVKKIFTQNEKLESFVMNAGKKPSESEIVKALGLSDILFEEEDEYLYRRCDIPGSKDYLEVIINEYRVPMSEFIENHPSAIEMWLFYEREKEKSVFHERLCYLTGENGISEEDFQEVCGKVKNMKQREIRHLVAENQANLRICILSDVIEKKSIIESFLSITKIIGTQDINEMIESKDIDFKDFEFWFNRFSSGNWDLDQKTFSDMPIEVVENVVEELNISSQMRLRKVSHGLRNIVDQMTPSINYCDGPRNPLFLTIYKSKGHDKYWKRSYNGEDNMNIALDGIKMLLNNRRLRLKDFTWDKRSSEEDKKLVDILNSLNHKIEIVSLDSSLNGDLMIDLVKIIKPETLKKIVFGGEFEPIYIEQLAQLDQWNHAKAVHFYRYIPDFSRCLPHFQHFEMVTVENASLSMDDILFVKNIFIQNDKLERFSIGADSKPTLSEISETFGFSEIYFDEENRYFFGQYDIPGANNYLGVTITDCEIDFVRKTSD
uniref:F-box domain-containing protein n=1 Tax=Caenorhabditis tropicalis TaxID=1561998 RepID=A0A1I7UI78_9PELO